MSASILRVALTGGIATGKSYCLSRFAQLGVPVLDADKIARDVVKAGSPALAAVIDRFGPAVRRPDGELNRQALAKVVFTDAAARSDLEAIVHPAVYAAIEEWFESLPSLLAARGAPPSLAVAPALEDSLASRRPQARVAMADIPLLYETGRDQDFDRVIVAACTPQQQRERLMARDGLPLDEAQGRIDSQLPIDDKVRRADFVIDTSGTPEETDRQVDQVYGELINV